MSSRCDAHTANPRYDVTPTKLREAGLSLNRAVAHVQISGVQLQYSGAAACRVWQDARAAPQQAAHVHRYVLTYTMYSTRCLADIMLSRYA